MLFPVTYERKRDRATKVGFIDAQGNQVVPPKYDYIGNFSEDRCAVEVYLDISEEHDRLRGFIDSSGREVVPLRPSYFHTDFSEGLAQLEDPESGKVGFIDSWGRFVIPPQFECEYEGEVCKGFSEGLAAVAFADGMGYIDRQGREVFGQRFDDAGRFNNGLAVVQPLGSAAEDGYFIDKSGQRLMTVPCVIPYRSPGFQNGLCQVRIATGESEWRFKTGFINTSGELAFDNVFNVAGDFNEGVCVADRRWEINSQNVWKKGVIDTQGKWIIKPIFDDIGSFNHGLSTFSLNGKYGLINIEGEIVFGPWYHHIQDFSRHMNRSFGVKCSELVALTPAFPVKPRKLSDARMYIDRCGSIVCPTEKRVNEFEK
ncbi:WG repeat-containing protein [Noviherbaspirillum humi]|nr:WG repeat-containing protein [Noviherbaspirillum humi]